MGVFSSHMATKRFLIGTIGGLIAGFLSSYLILKLNFVDLNGDAYWGSGLMVSILFNRFLIGLFVFLAGIFFDAVCPVCGVRFFPALHIGRFIIARTEFRGVFIGLLTSLELAFSSYLGGASIAAFVTIIVMGGFYGMVINWAVTREKFRRYVVEEQEKKFREEHAQREKERQSYVLGEGTSTVKKFEKEEPETEEETIPPKKTPIEDLAKKKKPVKKSSLPKRPNKTGSVGKVNVRHKHR